MAETSLFTLPNGLRVAHCFVPDTTQVTFSLLYNVGSRDESPDHTGLAHLFEHLMFGGSAHVPDFDYAMEMASATNNAWTSPDFTNFYCTLPSANLATAFWAESDRMLAPSIAASLDVQKRVVIEEFKQTCLNRPYGDAGHRLRALLYRVHPYRWPTIGLTPDHVAQVTLAEAERFFNTHYSPDNAVLSVCGGVERGRVEELAGLWFGPIERRRVAPRAYPQEPPVESPRREEVRADVPQTRIYIALPMPGESHPDYKVADLLTDILASGGSSRFYRRLVMGTDVFTQADASVSGSEEPGYLLLTAAIRGNGDDDIRRAEEMLWREALAVASDGVSDAELQRALCRYESQRTFAHISPAALARELALCTMRGTTVDAVTRAYRRITTADIRRVAATLLRPDRACTLVYRPR